MTKLCVTLLGTTEIEIDKRPLRQKKSTNDQALLIYLLVEAAQVHQREALMTLLWPWSDQKSAQSSLRQTLHRLRQKISTVESKMENEAVSLLLSDMQTIQVNSEAAYWLDVQQFRQHIEATRQHQHDTIIACPNCLNQLQTAVSLYKGEFLADFYLADSAPFEEWLVIKREAIRRQALDALETLSQAALNQESYLEAEKTARRHLEIDNLDERAYRQLMKALSGNDQRHEALSEYENCRRLLSEELGMTPSAATTQLYEKIKAGDAIVEQPQPSGVQGYNLQEQIGVGSFGVVHKGIQKGIEREVAIKIVHPQYANQPDFIRRFEQEAHIVATLEHPHIVPLYDFWRDPKGAYLVMRLLRGGNLGDADHAAPWSLATAVALTCQIASALHVAHRQGIIHRDVKPANILLDKDGNGYLSDFGIAKNLAAQTTLTQEQPFLGSPSYVSPEQIRNEPVTDKTDQYSLGLVLFQLLAGSPPFTDESLLDLLKKQVDEPLPLLVEQNGRLHPAIDTVLQQATAKRPSDRFPDMLAFAQALQALDDDHSAIVAVPQRLSLPDEAVENPYKGLRPFQEADADLFYGREALIAKLCHHLQENRFLAVVGPSGSGKSSVVKAGVLPALRSGAVSGSENWFFAQMNPSTHPMIELESAVMKIAVNPPASLLEPLQKDAHGLVRILTRVLPQDEDVEEPSQLLLVIDQFEELFTLVEKASERQQFVDLLLTAVTEAHGRLRVIITLRADFYDRPMQQPGLSHWLQEHTELVLPLTATELEAAITTPAAKMGVTLQPGLVTAIVSDVNEQPGALPLLQYALTELFAQRDGRVMTHTAYQGMGGIGGALGKRAETLYDDLGGTGQDTVRQLFLRLVTLGEGTEDTRRRVRLAELQGVEKGQYQEDQMTAVLEAYGRHRLLTFDHDPLTRDSTVEVAHEALLREWPRLRSWLQESREDIRQQRALNTAAAEWKRADRDDSFLLRGGPLTLFAEWVERTHLALTGSERAFLEASMQSRVAREQAEQERREHELQMARDLAKTERKRADEQKQAVAEQKKAAKQLRRRAVYLVGLLVMVMFVALLAGWQAVESDGRAQALATQEAITQKSLKESEQLRLASAAKNALADSSSGELPILLALHSLHNDYSPEADEALVGGLAQGFSQTLSGHGGRVRDMVFSADGRYLVTVGTIDNNLIVWDGQSGQLVNQISIIRPLSVALGSSGDVALVGTEETVFWLDLQSGERHEILSTRTGDLNNMAVAIAPQNDTFVVANGGNFTILDRQTEAVLQTISGHRNSVTAAVYTPSGESIVTSSVDQTVRLWDVQTGEELYRFEGHLGPVMSVAVSSDGRLAASGSLDGTARLIDLESHTELFAMPNGPTINKIDGFTLKQQPFAPLDHLSEQFHQSIGVAFSNNGKQLFTSGTDHVVRQWDVESGQLLNTWPGIGGDAIAISPSSYQFVSSNAHVLHMTQILSDNEPRLFSAHRGSVVDVAISPDDQSILSIGLDPNARVWDVDSRLVAQEFQLRFTGFAGPSTQVHEGDLGYDVLEVAFAPDGEAMFIRNRFGNLNKWDIQSESFVQSWGNYLGGGVGLADNTQFILIPGISGKWGWLLNGETDEFIQEFFFPSSVVQEANSFYRGAVANDGRFVAMTFHEDNRLSLWATDSGEVVREFVGHTDWINDYAFAPDSHWLVSGSNDGTARIWDVESGAELYRFIMPAGAVTAVLFSPDGRLIATGGDDNKVRLWEIATGEQVRVFAGHEDTINTLDFTSDGQQLLSGSDDKTMRLWRVNLDEVIALACRQLPRDLTAVEKAQYGIDDDTPICDQF